MFASSSIKTSVSLTNTSASIQRLAHNQWNGSLLSTIVDEEDGDNTENTNTQTHKHKHKHRRFCTKAGTQSMERELVEHHVVGEEDGDNAENMLQHNQWSPHIIGWYTIATFYNATFYWLVHQ